MMATVDMKDLHNKKVGSVELPDEIFGYPYKEHLIHEAAQSPRFAALRNAQDQDSCGSLRIRQEAVPSEGDGSRSSGRQPTAHPSSRWNGVRSGASRLFLQDE